MGQVQNVFSPQTMLAALDYARAGISGGIQQLAVAAQQVANPARPLEPAPLVAAVTARNAVDASARVLSAIEATLGTLLNVRA